MIEVALKQLLAANAPLTAVVGTRIYPVKLPQNVVYPALSFFRAATQTDHTYQGSSGLSGPLFQVSVWAQGDDGYLEVATISELVRKAIDGFKGSMADVEISGIFLRTLHDTFEDDTGAYQRPMDFEIWHADAA